MSKISIYSNIFQELPKRFVEKFDTQLDKGVQLWMADRNVWIAYYCEPKNCISNLERMLNKYSICNDYILVFHYIAKSTFYLSIFNKNGVDIFNDINANHKLLIKEVVVPAEYHNIHSSKNSTSNEGNLPIHPQIHGHSKKFFYEYTKVYELTQAFISTFFIESH